MNEVDSSKIFMSNLKISPSAKALLRTAGFKTLQDVLQTPPSRLAKSLGLSPQQVLPLLAEVRSSTSSSSSSVSPSTTALALLERDEEGEVNSIVTYCKSVDQLLQGGVAVGEITELCGVPGSGKTQLCMQVAVDVTIPQCFGGLGGECLLVDTEGSFSVERAKDMAQAVLRHLKRVARSSGPQELRETQSKTLEREYDQVKHVLEKIHFCRVHNHGEQVAAIFNIENVLRNRPRIKLVIIDSIAFHFRHDFVDMAMRTRLLNSMAQTLNHVAAKHRLAVLVSNQMTTKFSHRQDESHSSYFAPALGESWSHAVTNRMIVERTEEKVAGSLKRKRTASSINAKHPRSDSASAVGEAESETHIMETVTHAVRKVTLAKSPYLHPGVARFIITQSGIRDAPNK